MNKETQRIIVASILITLVAYFYPTFWTVNNPTSDEPHLDTINNTILADENNLIDETNNISPQKNQIDNEYKQIDIVVKNRLYNTTISNYSGGTIINSIMVEKNNGKYKYLQKNLPQLANLNQNTIINVDNTQDEQPVVLNGGNCNPCLGYYDNNLNEYQYFDRPFRIITPNIETEYNLEESDSLTIDFQYTWNDMVINKSVTFYGNSYETHHQYSIENELSNKFEIIWYGGLKPIDEEDFNWDAGGMMSVSGSNAMIGQNDETESIKITDDQRYIEKEEYNGNTDWASVRTKYFIAAILSDRGADYGTMSGYIDSSNQFPSYNVTLGYYNRQSMTTSVYLGPLDIDHIVRLNNTLDETINFGFQIVRPIGKFVLWFLKLIHNTFNLNYGVCLIIFAVIIQLLTSPLTKKTYESSRKMQEIQPLVKKIQEKYKNDAQKMNQEVMNIYRDKGVNPLGGCLPLLLQMPLLMAIFSVFRDTIEFRGASFFLWISDLSQPDIIFHLPFSIPLYGDHVAFLPILMGISIFLTQKLSMATMDPAQKPMMYIMNGFFILIFNSFPAGLNLYYTVYNLLNYYQQKSIRSQNK